MKKNRTKRILSMLLTLCMVLTLVPMTAFAANAPANVVTINVVTLDSIYPYLVDGAKAESGSLNGTDCTAHLNVATGTLSLWNYNGKEITTSTGGAKDLTVILKGTNTITGDLKNRTDGGNLMITAEEDASLNITNSRNSDGSLAGISTSIAGTYSGGGSISITGKANITISVTNTSTNVNAKSYGLFAKQGISISDSASLDVTSTCHSSSDYSAYGIYTGNQSFTVNTSGVIRVDVSNTQNAKPTAIRASSYSLTKVDQLLCKYNSTGTDFFAGFTPPAGFAYNKGVVSGTPTTEIRGGSTPVRTATFVGVRNNFGEWTGQYFSGDSVGLSAETFGIPFSSWQSSAGSFSSTTSPNTTFTMPNEDVTIMARYNAFNYHPYFTKTESGKGTIIFNLHALPDSAPRLVTKTGDETNIVGGTYFYGDNLPREVTITDGTGLYNVPAGEYRVAVEIGYLWHFSEVFTVNYDAPVTTYAATVTGGTGGGNYAEGATVSITANAPATGKVFDKWTTSDGVVFANTNSATTTFVMPAKAVTVTATYKDAPVDPDPEKPVDPDPEKFSYKIIKGANGKWDKTSKAGLEFISNGDFDKFEEVKVDGKTIDKKHYSAKAGSTIVTLKDSLLSTLGKGDHSLTLVFEDGKVETKFTILEKETLPKTGGAVYPTMLFGFILLLAGVFMYRRREA